MATRPTMSRAKLARTMRGQHIDLALHKASAMGYGCDVFHAPQPSSYRPGKQLCLRVDEQGIVRAAR